MPLSIRPLAISLTVALMGAVGMVSAGPATAAQDPQASPPPPQAAPPQARERRSAPPMRRQDARPAPRRPQREQMAPRERSHEESRLSDSIRRVERRTRGRVLSAESMPYEGRSVNRIKVIDDTGRVRVIVDDPQASGSQPRTRRDDD